MKKPGYTYRAKVKYIYDGDTWTVDIDLGFGVWLKDQKLRLFGIDTPEMRGSEKARGTKVRDYCRKVAASHNHDIIIETFKDEKGKYGRWLANIYFLDEETSVNKTLLDMGLAREVKY